MAQFLNLSAEAGPVVTTLDYQGDRTVITATYSVAGGATTTLTDVGSILGSAYDDTFTIRPNNAQETFTFSSFDGGAGYDSDYGAGSITSTTITGVEFYSGFSVGLSDANFTGVGGGLITVVAGGSNIHGGVGSFDGATLTAGHSVALYASVFTGSHFNLGAGDDVIFGALISGSGGELHGGLGYDALYEPDTGAALNYVPQFDGVEFIQFGNGHANLTALRPVNFVDVTGGQITVALGAMGGEVNASTLGAAQHAYLIGSVAADNFAGGAADDIFSFAAGKLTVADAVNGGLGHDTVYVSGGGAAGAGGVTGVEFYLLDGASSAITLTDANFTGVTGQITVGVTSGASVDASALSASHGVYFGGSSGIDTFLGGAGGDLFSFGPSTLTSADTVTGGAGSDLLQLSAAGLVDVAGVSGVEFYTLAGGGANTVVLHDANLTGLVTLGVQAGAAGDTLDASAVTSALTQVFLFGGAGSDTLTGGGGSTMIYSGGGADLLIGGSGNDAFGFSSADSATIQGFQAGTDVIFFSDAAFDLGVNEGQGASVGFARIDPSLFSGNTDGTFATANERFSFDTATGHLFYAEDGSATLPGAIELVATLSGIASLSAFDLLFGA
jgi:hypothetical protein